MKIWSFSTKEVQIDLQKDDGDLVNSIIDYFTGIAAKAIVNGHTQKAEENLHFANELKKSFNKVVTAARAEEVKDPEVVEVAE